MDVLAEQFGKRQKCITTVNVLGSECTRFDDCSVDIQAKSSYEWTKLAKDNGIKGVHTIPGRKTSRLILKVAKMRRNSACTQFNNSAK